MPQKTVMLVLCFNRRNLELLTQVLQEADYQIIATNNYQELDRALSSSIAASLGLIDLSGCDRRIWDYCQQLREQNIPFFTFTPQYSSAVEQRSLAHGATSVLVKPVVIKNLLLLINSLVGKQI